MRCITVAEATALEIGEKVPSIRGKLTNLYDRNTGNNQHGEWSLQNGTLTDEKDAKKAIKVKFWNRPEIPKNWRNKVVYICATQSDKGLTGLEIEEDTYKQKEGVVKRMLTVKEKAELDVAGSKGLDGQEAPPQQQQKPTAPAQATAQLPKPGTMTDEQIAAYQAKNAAAHPKKEKTKEEIHAERVKHVMEVARFLNKRANAAEMVMTAVDYVSKRRAESGKTPMTAEHYQALCASLFISLDRGGLVDDMPTGPLEKYLPPKPESAKPTQTETTDKKK